jgi:release factor glutamine methyltransferase
VEHENHESTIAEAIQAASSRLLHVAVPRLEAQLLLAHLLGKSTAWLIAWSDSILDSRQLQAYAELVERRHQGIPIAHLTAEREFWSLPLRITPDTLIPRPESELLVEICLSLRPAAEPLTIVDLGTGSGAIALAIASERPRWRILATDQSSAALRVAAGNAEALQITNVSLLQGDWFDALPAGTEADILVSNPPYIRADDPHLQQGDLRFEPRSALAAGADGLDAIRVIAAQAGNCLKPGGMLLLEHGYDQGADVRRLLHDAAFAAITTHSDLAGHERVTLGQRHARA